MLVELLRAVKKYGRRFSRHEFDRVAVKCRGTTIISEFGSWKQALEEAGLDLSPHRYVCKDQIPEHELLKELGRIWRDLGHHPSKAEWEYAKPKYSYTTYKTRFGGWLKACAAYIEYMSTVDHGSKEPKNRYRLAWFGLQYGPFLPKWRALKTLCRTNLAPQLIRQS